MEESLQLVSLTKPSGGGDERYVSSGEGLQQVAIEYTRIEYMFPPNWPRTHQHRGASPRCGLQQVTLDRLDFAPKQPRTDQHRAPGGARSLT